MALQICAATAHLQRSFALSKSGLLTGTVFNTITYIPRLYVEIKPRDRDRWRSPAMGRNPAGRHRHHIRYRAPPVMHAGHRRNSSRAWLAKRYCQCTSHGSPAVQVGKPALSQLEQGSQARRQDRRQRRAPSTLSRRGSRIQANESTFLMSSLMPGERPQPVRAAKTMDWCKRSRHCLQDGFPDLECC